MRSRGTLWAYTSTRTKRNLAFLWSALFLCSLLMQSMSLAAPTPVLAVHDAGLFELDGNVENEGAPGDDWNAVFSNGDAAFQSVFVNDPINGNGDKYFDGGSTKDVTNITSWLWTDVSQPQDKNDIAHAYAAAYNHDGDLIVFFGLDRYASNGAAQVGFWFLKGGLTVNADKSFTGSHQNGDVLVQIDFENGGANPVLRVYEWQSGLVLVSTGGSCATAPSGDLRCAIAATSSTDPAWPFDDKGEPGASNDIPAGGMVEGGINLTDLGLDEGCFATFLAETRSSPSPESTLSDFALGSFALCETPDISTQVKQNGSNVSAINMGESVVDTAVVTGDKGVAQGTIDFYVCGPANSNPDCSSGGTKVGATKDLSGGEATSDAFTPTQLGRYCFRAEYTPAAGSKYLAASHTNLTTECFRVLPAEVQITKTPDSQTKNAGESISFTLAWGNVGEGVATGVVVTDTLPTTPGTSWSISGFTGTGSTCSIAGGVLTCNVGSIPGTTPNSGSVTITSATTPASCAVIDNEATITSTNDGTDTDPGQITVLCPDVSVDKTPDDADVNADDAAVFSIVVTNHGDGTATNVTLDDPLPADYAWTLGDVTGDTTGVTCQITGAVGSQVLECSDASMASGDSFTVKVSTTTSPELCATIPNFATVDAVNEPNSEAYTDDNTDPGDITVNCPDLVAEKVADEGPFSAGDEIGFTVTIRNDGLGTAYDATASDDLPAGFTWSIDGAANGWSIVAGDLVFGPEDLGPGESRSVHVVATSGPEDCGLIDNTVTVFATNESEDLLENNTASDDLVVNCPNVVADKEADASPVDAGDQIGFTVTISNTGAGVAYDATATDTLPAGISWAIDGPANGWTLNGSTLTFGPADLAAGASASVHIVGLTTPEVCGTVPNTVTVDADNEPANAGGDNTASDSVDVLCPDLEVVKDADDATISAGEGASFTITVTNTGEGLAKDVTLTDELPDGIDWTEDSAACSIAPDSGTVDQVLTCDFGDLAAGASVVVHVSGETGLDDCGELPNLASVAASNEPSDALDDNVDDALITVDCPDLGIAKTADHPEPVVIGSQIGFTVEIANNGAGTAFDVHVEDTLDADFTWSIESQTGGWTLVGNLLTFDGDLPAGTLASVHVVASTTVGDEDQCGIVPNTATLTHPSIPPADDSSAETVRCPDIDLEKEAESPTAEAGQTVTFTIDVAVVDGPVTNAVVTDVLPAGQTYVDGSQTSSVPATTFAESADGTTLTWTFASLATGDPAVTITYDVVIAGSPATMENEAEVCADAVPACASDVALVQVPGIDLVKTAGDAADGATLTTLAGPVTYTYIVENTGPTALQNVTVTDDNGTPGDTSDDFAATCPKTTLAVGESMTCTATVDVASSRTNVAVARGATVAGTPVEAEDDAVVVVRNPQLTIEKSNDAPLVVGLPTAEEGETVTFELAYDITDGPVTNGVITDVLPEGLIYIAGSATSNAEFTFVGYDVTTRTLRWEAPTVTADGTLSYQAFPGPGAADIAQPLVNVATIDSDETQPDSAESPVFVPAPPLPATATPKITLPPTDVLDGGRTGTNPGFTLMVVLLALAGFTIAVAFLTPAPARARRHDRRGR